MRGADSRHDALQVIQYDLCQCNETQYNMRPENTSVFFISLVLATMFFLGCENAGQNLPRLEYSSIGLVAAYPLWSSSHSNAQVVLTLSNRTAQVGTVVLPRPLRPDPSVMASSNEPMLVLIAKDQSTRSEEGFVLTALDKLEHKSPNYLVLKPHQVAQVSYPLTSFYMWGQGEPISGSMLEHLQLGNREIAVWAEIAYSEAEPQEGVVVLSPPVILKCSFPAWLFSRSIESTGSALPTNTIVPP
jgi:hypothetical protein